MKTVARPRPIYPAYLRPATTMKTPLSLTVLTLSALAAAVPHQAHIFKVKEAVVPPQDWTKAHKTPSDLTINLRIALPQSNFALLEQHLYEVR